ncbi:hypothetical protein [Salinisphaera sp. G21_0]|uniref:hypothetical protein n=1 Tax=Salinisphaera sp. G21_0 TaxID=2821094 RepID=UPI001ADB21EB|nr:hypothetical protein [Salinisphaera sp. G21_0]MBO9482726.1 hypothetical protein [Salinisphaera sp. G21_0]
MLSSQVLPPSSALSPNYTPEHQRHINQPSAPVANTLPAENRNDKTSLVANVLQAGGLASKALSCWAPNVSAVSDAVGTLCSSFYLAHSLDNMAMSGKSDKGSTSGAENVSTSHSQKMTDNNRKDEKPGKPVTAFGTTNSVSGPAIATVTLMAMDRLAGAAAESDFNNTTSDNMTLGGSNQTISTPPSNATSTTTTMATSEPPSNATSTTTTMATSEPPSNATSNTTTLATSAEASMTFSGMPPATALPITSAGVLSTEVVVSLGTAFTLLAGIGLYLFYQYRHRQGEAQQQAEPEVPLEHLSQQANN